jgi:signal transduction histidine kinase
MRRGKWAYYAVSIGATLALAACASDAAPLRLVTQAELAVQPINARVFPAAPATVPANLAWYGVSLPFVEKRPERLGANAIARIWVRLPASVLRLETGGSQALSYAVHLASGAHVTLYVDGSAVAETDKSLSNSWNQAVFLSLPRGVDASRAPAALVLAYDCHVGLLGCGVPAYRLGALAAAHSWFESQQFWRIDVPRITSAAMLIIGALALLFWSTRRRESAYLLFAVAATLWAFRALHYHLSHYPQPEDWFWWLTVSALTWQCVVVYQFAWRLQNQRRPRSEGLLVGIALLLTLGALPLSVTSGWMWEQVVYAVQALTSLLVTALLTLTAWRLRTREHTVLALALWINLAFGIHDFLLETWQLAIDGAFWLPYGAVPLFGAFIYGLARRYRAAIDAAESLNAVLESRLTERQQELEISYQRLRAAEAKEARHDERQRLIREMHDGIGSTLIASLASVERGAICQAAVASMLRDTVEELRLTIDSLEPVAGDLVTLLATLRYRMAPRLERMGLSVEWKMAEVPNLPWLDATAALQILRIVQESIANVIKHARARCITIETRVAGTLQVIVADDGVGYCAHGDAVMRTGRGLSNIRLRAAQIGATVALQSGADGTTVVLTLPHSQWTGGSAQ